MEKNIKIHCLGSGDAFSSGGRFNACYYVTAPAANFLIDCGATTMLAMKRYGLTTEDIDLVMISHFHGDHYGGLPFLILEAAYVQKRKKPLSIVSPKGGKKRIQLLLEACYPSTTHLLDTLDIRFYEYEKEIQLWKMRIQGISVLHAEASSPHALRIRISDKVIAYSGDTEWTDHLLQVAEHSDIFICECNFYAHQVAGHLNFKTLQEKRPLLKTKRIILTHLGEEMLQKIDDLNIEVAEEGKLIAVL